VGGECDKKSGEGKKKSTFLVKRSTPVESLQRPLQGEQRGGAKVWSKNKWGLTLQSGKISWGRDPLHRGPYVRAIEKTPRKTLFGNQHCSKCLGEWGEVRISEDCAPSKKWGKKVQYNKFHGKILQAGKGGGLEHNHGNRKGTRLAKPGGNFRQGEKKKANAGAGQLRYWVV